jgi:hypothetical protein
MAKDMYIDNDIPRRKLKVAAMMRRDNRRRRRGSTLPALAVHNVTLRKAGIRPTRKGSFQSCVRTLGLSGLKKVGLLCQ